MNTSRAYSPFVRLAALCLAVLVALVGCGGDGTTSEETAPPGDAPSATEPTSSPSSEEPLDSTVPDLCTLFTAEDFTEVTGEPALEPESQAETGAIRGTCTINAESGFPLVVIGAYNEADREDTMELFGAEPVDDLGVEAYWQDTLGLLVPLEGRDWYLQVMATEKGADLDTSVRVAEIVLDRL